MTPDRLIEEGRRLARPCLHLKTSGRGEAAAVWYPRSEADIRRGGQRAWLTFHASLAGKLFMAPQAGDFMPLEGFLTVFSDEKQPDGGRLEFGNEWPARGGAPLYATAAQPLPPIEVVFQYGSAAVGEWLADNKWPRDKRYGGGFDDCLTADAYLQRWLQEQPVFTDGGVAAIIGGWHPLRTDPDWYEFTNERLLVQTLHDAEPWIEAWQLRKGGFKVMRRTT